MLITVASFPNLEPRTPLFMPAPDFTPLTTNQAARRIMDAARANGGEARIVGGAVRDALLGRTAHEIDFACTLPPEKMMDVLAKQGIKTVPTGIEFGTITAVIDGQGYEITTLRRDVDTDGRHATVAFTDDWQGDAARRDFTMNALYLDTAGKLYDYFGGQKDAAEGRVHFIGDAAQRIQEDVLRILRFFRFYAWFGRGVIDAEGLAACRAAAGLIPQLSVERVWREIMKLLAADQPAASWRLMCDAEILAAILPEAANVARLESLLKTEQRYEIPPSPLRRLAALLEDSVANLAQKNPSPPGGRLGGGSARTFCEEPDHSRKPSTSTPPLPPPQGEGNTQSQSLAMRLKLSKREAMKLQQLMALPPLLNGKFDPIPFRRALYEYGVDDARDAALLNAARHPGLDLEPALAVAAGWDNPVFPLQGQDLLKLGMAAGPAMGQLLQALEGEWIAADFKPTREECLAMARQRLASIT